MKYRLFESQHDKEISEQYHCSSLLSKVIDYKQLSLKDYQSLLNPRLIYHDFSLFSEAELVLERIEEAIENKEKICVYGDYDCDGIMATTILVQGFLKRGVKVGYHIPHRYQDGYGLNADRVRQIAAKGYHLIITVDNGIKSFEAIDVANELGIDVIVTDHHEYDDDLPEAVGIIHTKLSPDYPFKEISGAFIAYKLAVALNDNKQDKYLFSLAAIATVADMMPLLDENRSLVIKGLEFINEEKYPSIQLLLGDKKCDAHAISYSLAPKINSFGRLPEYVHPNNLVRYFFKDAPLDYLKKMADNANKINNMRKSMTASQYNLAVSHNEGNFLYYGSADIHEGIMGLIASRYTNENETVSFVMHYDKDNRLYKGSARSCEGFSLNDFLVNHHDYLNTWGGHEYAAGFSLNEENYEAFKQQISDALEESHMESYQDIIAIGLNDISLFSINELSQLEPYGEGNKEPLFILRNIPVKRIYTLSNGKHLKIDIEYNKLKMSALAFSKGSLYDSLKDLKSLSLVGTLEINEFRNTKNIQFMIKDIVSYL